jgi:hypothetical protein
VLVVVKVVKERLTVRLDVHHHPEEVPGLAGKGLGAAGPLVDGEVTRAPCRTPR